MSLKNYHQKRNFEQTTKPKGTIQEELIKEQPLRFVVQMHHASRLHYDFRIELDGVFKSWAVPKGPSQDSTQQHLAVQVEDHPLEYGDFEGIIPKGNYGAGTVMIWDQGTYIERNSTNRKTSEEAVRIGLEKRHITLILTGSKLQGEFALIGLSTADPKAWLLVKKRDEFSTREPFYQAELSVKTGRNLEEIKNQAPSKEEIWLPKKAQKKK